jgi:uncharacterized protein
MLVGSGPGPLRAFEERIDDTVSPVAKPIPDSVRLVGEGLFDWPPSTSQTAGPLHGARCSRCQEIVFPHLLDCPLCMQPEVMEPYDVRGAGTLVDFVITQRGPAGFAVPYVQGYVKLDDGPTIYSMLTGVEATESGPKVGERMRMVLEAIRKEGDVEIVGWKFRPEVLDHA